MGLKEDLTVLLGEDKVEEALKVAGTYMIPKEENRKSLEKLKALQDEYESLKKKDMTAEELYNAKIKEAEDIKRDFSVRSNKLEAERAFVNAGLSKEVYSKLLETVVSEDSEKTQTAVNEFIGILGKERESVANKTKESLLNQTKKPDNPDNTQHKSPNIKTFI